MRTMAILKGLLILALFGAVLAWLIPAYVPRPRFIPGFAPAPSMWPWAVSLLGASLGALTIVLALLRPSTVAPEMQERDWEVSDPPLVLVGRFLLILGALLAFVLLAPRLGFVLSGMLLTGAAILLAGERERWLATLAVSVLGPLLLWYFFSSFLGTRFPQGTWLRALGF